MSRYEECNICRTNVIQGGMCPVCWPVPFGIEKPKQEPLKAKSTVGVRKMKLIRNALQTPDGTLIESTHRHDYVTHTDANGKTYCIDGGLSYVRSSAHGDEVYLTLYDNEPHEVQRVVLKWGTYGKNGDQPLTLVPIAEMEDEHLEAVLDRFHVSDVRRAAMTKELEYRQNVLNMYYDQEE